MRLDGVRVWITRPQPQADALAAQIREMGGSPLTLPLLEIEPLPDAPEHRGLVLDLDLFQKVIFISRPAAHHGMELINSWWPQIPVAIEWWAIGAGTAAALADYGISANCPDECADSESLLENKAFFKVLGERILIIKGQGGRTLLHDVLAERGASVAQLPVYRRKPPSYEQKWLKSELERAEINGIVATSGQIVTNLLEYINPADCKAMLFVPSERVAQLARRAGFSRIEISAGASTNAVISALYDWQCRCIR